jgi:hypothetical protein
MSEVVYFKGDRTKPGALKILIKKPDGTIITVWHLDLGESVQGIDSDGYLFPTFTSLFRGENFQELVQVDKRLCLASGNGAQFRLAEDFAFLEGIEGGPNEVLDFGDR